MLTGFLNDFERFSRGLERCTANAEHSRHIEVSQLWQSIASSYDFLLKREKRLEEETAGRTASKASPSVAPLPFLKASGRTWRL